MNLGEMPIREIQMQRFSIVSSRPFDEVVARVGQSTGHPDTDVFRKNIAAAKSNPNWKRSFTTQSDHRI